MDKINKVKKNLCSSIAVYTWSYRSYAMLQLYYNCYVLRAGSKMTQRKDVVVETQDRLDFYLV